MRCIYMQYISMAKANIFIIIKHFVHTGTYDLEREKSKEI